MLVFVISFSACSPDEKGGDGKGGGNTGDKTAIAALGQQAEYAKETCENFYSASERNGGFCADPVNTVVNNSNMITQSSTLSESAVDMDDIRDIINELTEPSTSQLSPTMKTYVSDIFSYSQIQLSLINEYDSAALINEYNLTYDETDWDNADLGSINSTWFKSVLPYTASFSGSDTESGRVYCKQKHTVGANDVLAKLEYYYGSDNDMGVTTLNWHYNAAGKLVNFEYHCYDSQTKTVVFAPGSIGSNDQIIFSNIFIFTLDNTYFMGSSPSEYRTVLTGFFSSEIIRISDKIKELEESNSALAELSHTKSDSVTTHEVDFDFIKLITMLGES